MTTPIKPWVSPNTEHQALVQVGFIAGNNNEPYMGNLTALSDDVIVENNIIELPPKNKYEMLTFVPPNVEDFLTNRFKFLDLCIVDNSANVYPKQEWKSPIFGIHQHEENGPLFSTISVFLPKDLDTRVHSFSIVYYLSLYGVKVFDPGIREQES